MLPTEQTKCPLKESGESAGASAQVGVPIPLSRPCGPPAFFDVQGKTVHAKAV